MRHQRLPRGPLAILLTGLFAAVIHPAAAQSRAFNAAYSGANLNHIAFPVGGIGAGMFCLEGTGAISHLSIRNAPDFFNEPPVFAALVVKGQPKTARVLEGPVPDWKKYSMSQAGLGDVGRTWGLARYRNATFRATFPFAEVSLNDAGLPAEVRITGWSPFIPTDPDNSSLPMGALEYRIANRSPKTLEYIFSFNSPTLPSFSQVRRTTGGFVLSEDSALAPDKKGDLAFFTDDPAAVVDYCWFRGGWWDPLTMAWNHIRDATVQAKDPQPNSSGASIEVPFTLKPGEVRTIRLMITWYVPDSRLRIGENVSNPADSTVPDTSPSWYYKPWYSSRFADIDAAISYWRAHYSELRGKTTLFKDAFYRSTLPPEVMEAVAANLSILKSPTVLRQSDGRFWGWEGSDDNWGSCAGSCTHVWNYAQAVCHLFPSLERSLRRTEFFEDQNAAGHQQFRAALPIRPQAHTFYAASDGQLGGIMKVYRDWRISGDSSWLRNLYPRVKQSLDYCIATWDPRHTGTLEEPHHNTYDIEFWGPDPMTTSFYLGALEAFTEIGAALGENVDQYTSLFNKGKLFMEQRLFNGKYFNQKIEWTGLNAADPVAASQHSFNGGYSAEAVALLQKEGPKYQYGKGCLSDGVLGDWMARVCGLPEPLDRGKVKSHLQSVYTFNEKKDLSDYSNPQRPGYALGNEGGLLLCTWPEGGQLSLPFVYSNEVWTGIEYQVASHLIFEGKVAEGLDIVRTCRRRYDGRVRNPFDEYECGHWYARAMSSYALIEALTGVRYDAVTRTLYVDSRIGDFTSFLSTDSGFGNVTSRGGKVTLDVAYGKIPVEHIVAGASSPK
ncbi:MAG TPA: GH116 family glycosyl hydrolase [Puia sp.]|nr:GH116 family glycosyl hydrolase [Puia sp.]